MSRDEDLERVGLWEVMARITMFGAVRITFPGDGTLDEMAELARTKAKVELHRMLCINGDEKRLKMDHQHPSVHVTAVNAKWVGDPTKKGMPLEALDAQDGLWTAGQRAFQAYNRHRGGVNHLGKKTPEWEELPEEIREAWEAAAWAVIGTKSDWDGEKV